jgi:NAD-dependent dihydropyrimidine dehydrogenase PreA subunit
MKRKIIHIDEDRCNGCGQCVPSCHEGAITIIDGKARLAADALCDGLGACLGECPQGAITIEEREAGAYDEIKTLGNIMAKGPAAVAAHVEHLKSHGQDEYVRQAQEYLQQKGKAMGSSGCGCPGGMARDLRREEAPGESAAQGPVASQLRQWPVQLKLLNPQAPYFQDAEIVVSADCAAFAFGDFHRKFLKGKVLVIFCPKLDEDLQEYVAKLAEIFRSNTIRSVAIVRMEVPCCGGTTQIVEDALRQSGKNIILKEYTISLRGEII